MTRVTGIPAKPPAAPWLLLVALLMLSGTTAPAAGESSREPVDLALEKIARAFRAREPEPLRLLLPASGKVFVSLTTIGDEAGYYGPDQIYFIFQRIFNSHRTVRFNIQTQRIAEPEEGSDRTGLVLSVGSWAFERQDGRDGQCRIHFFLAMRGDRWTLVQIREAR